MKKIKNLSRKGLALLVVLVMCLSLMQLSALAETVDVDTEQNVDITVVEQQDSETEVKDETSLDDGDESEANPEDETTDEDDSEKKTDAEDEANSEDETDAEDESETNSEDEGETDPEITNNDGEDSSDETKIETVADETEEVTREYLNPMYSPNLTLNVATVIINEFNKGAAISTDDLPSDFSVTVTVTYCDREGNVQTEEKVFTLDSEGVEFVPNATVQGTTVRWPGAFVIPNWYTIDSTNTLTADDFDPKYTTTITAVERGFHVDGYTCTTVVNGGFAGGDKSEESADPYTWTMTHGVTVTNGGMGNSTVGLIFNNTYRVMAPSDTELGKVGVTVSCDDDNAHSNNGKGLRWTLKSGYEASGYLTMTKDAEGQWIVSVDAEKWLTVYNNYVKKNGIADFDHQLVTTQPDTVTFTWDEAAQTWVPDKTTIEIHVSDGVAKIVREGKTYNYATLQAAIDDAQSGETVILLADVTENVTVSKAITLDLNSKTVDGGQNGTVVTINGGDMTLTGDGTITGGYGVFPNGGGVTIKNGGSLTMESGTITGNTANANGGGVFVYDGTFTMNGGTISNNDGGNYGGGVYVYNSIADMSGLFTMNGGTISGNKAASGGGVGASAWKQETGRTAIVLNSGVIEDNTVTGNGGGVAMESTDAPEYAASYGAAGQHELVIGEGVTIRNNIANQGGGIYSYDSVTTITGATITGNKAEGSRGNGGGVFASAGTVTLNAVTITGNTAANAGGGIFSGNTLAVTTVTVSNSKLYGNSGSRSADVYSENTALTLPAAAEMGGKLNDLPITGWFWDGGGQYAWGENYVVARNSVSQPTTKQCLIAAYGFYTVTYTDGADGSAFENKTATVAEGTATPAFGADPTRDGFEFDGWSPEVAETVTENVVYTAQWKGYVTVTYTDGVGGTAFETQSYTVLEGTDTPVFDGTPTRSGYTFNGWSPEVAGTVTESVTYTAQWTQNSSSGSSGGSSSSGTPSNPSSDPTESSDPVEIDEPDVPLTEPPEEADDTEIVEIDVPLSELPEEVNNTELVDIGETDVPLADVPETGDNSALWLITAGTAGVGLVWLILSKKRTENEG